MHEIPKAALMSNLTRFLVTWSFPLFAYQPGTRPIKESQKPDSRFCGTFGKFDDFKPFTRIVEEFRVQGRATEKGREKAKRENAVAGFSLFDARQRGTQVAEREARRLMVQPVMWF